MPRMLVVPTALCLLYATASQAQMPVTRVVVVEARTLDARPTITLVGTVTPVRRSRVSSEVSGIVAEMPVRRGDYVQAGDVLCHLDDTAVRLRLAVAEARLGSLKASHDELQAGTRAEELKRLEAVVDQASAEHDRWKFEMERVRDLYQGQESNAKEFTETRAAFLTSLRRKIAAEADYEAGVNGPRPETIAKAAYDVAEQQAVVGTIKHELAKATIHAPFSGYVVTLQSEVGQWIPIGGQIVEMVDLDTVLVRVDVPESALPFLSVGETARVRIDALGRALEGTIKHIIRQADEQARTFPVEIELDNRKRLLAGGLFARVTVPAGPSRPVVAAPKDALVERSGIDYVAIVMPGKDGAMQGMLMAVTVGEDVRDWIAVTSGNVVEGTRVITRGNENMQPFPQPIQIVDDMGTPVAMPAPKANDSHGHEGGA